MITLMTICFRPRDSCFVQSQMETGSQGTSRLNLPVDGCLTRCSSPLTILWMETLGQVGSQRTSKRNLPTSICFQKVATPQPNRLLESGGVSHRPVDGLMSLVWQGAEILGGPSCPGWSGRSFWSRLSGMGCCGQLADGLPLWAIGNRWGTQYGRWYNVG